jgi:nitroreductase
MFNDLSTPIALLETRRSGKPRDMVAPGPDETQLMRIMNAAMRVPDHGKLAPWRFVVVDGDKRDALSDVLTRTYTAEKPDAGRLEIDAMDQFARQAPTLIVVLSVPIDGSKIPLYEPPERGACAGLCRQLADRLACVQ